MTNHMPTAFLVETVVRGARGALVSIGHMNPNCPAIADGVDGTPDELLDDPWPCSQCIDAGGNAVAIGFEAPKPHRQGGTTSPKAPAVAATEEQVIELMLSLERKFEVDDVTDALRAFANQWALAYKGDFEYMMDMKANAAKPRKLSQGMAKGVLNCFRADYFRQQAQARKAREAEKQVARTARDESSASGDQVPDGTYTVIFEDESYRTLRIKTQDADANFAAGETIVAFLSGPDNERNFTQFAFLKGGELKVWKKFKGEESALVEAMRVLMNDPLAAAKAYGLKSKRCGICGHKLTVKASIEAGIGPVCATYF